MGWYRRTKFAFDALHSLVSKNPIRGESLSTVNKSAVCHPSPICKNLCFKTFRVQRSLYNIINPFVVGPRRYYYVDRQQLRNFRPQGTRKWYKNPRHVLIVTLVGSGVLITVYFGNLETIPYTKRTHFVLLLKNLEKLIGEAQFEEMKAAFKGKILPPLHPESIRVRLIVKDIIGALQRGLRKEQVWIDPGYASESEGADNERSGIETLVALTKSAEDHWKKEEESIDDEWVHKSRRKGQESGLQSETGHLEGLNWEVLVVNEPVVNAFCLPGGKIIVFTGLLEHFRSDAEIATIIGHGVYAAVICC